MAEANLPPDLELSIHADIKNLSVQGRDGGNNRVLYVPYPSLERYWETNRIAKVLRHVSRPIPIETVQQRYLRVFTTLFWIGKIHHIISFISYNLHDDCWPREEAYQGWPSSFTDAFFNDFRREQWMFFPLLFDPVELTGRLLHPKHVLPINKEDLISGNVVYGGDAKVSKIEIHQSSNKLNFDYQTPPPITNEFALKKYHLEAEELRNSYEREKDAYVLVSSYGRADHVVRFYGSFEQNGVGYLVLEYVEGGTLRQYLNDGLYPQTRENVYLLWQSMAGLVRGLYRLHQLDDDTSPAFSSGIIHQDLTPDNIVLVKSQESRYKFEIKLMDFGRSAIGQTADGSSVLIAEAAHGSATYSSPQSSKPHLALRGGRDILTSASDIWSLGCIFLLVGSWIPHGPDMMETFHGMRYDELLAYASVSESGYGQAFHNGTRPLVSVSDTCHLIRMSSEEKAIDKITPKIMDLVEQCMLTERLHDRLDAKSIYASIDTILTEAEPDIGQSDTKGKPWSPSGGGSLLRSPHTPKRSLSQPLPRLSIDECLRYRHDMKYEQIPNPTVHSIVNRIITTLRNRDHLFLIENSASMQQHHEDVVKVFTGLSYIAKKIDKNGVELAFLSSPEELYESRKTVELIEIVRRTSYSHMPGLTEANLVTFLEKAIHSRLRHWSHPSSFLTQKRTLTLFIFTDANWGENRPLAAGVEKPIQNLMDTMAKRDVARTKVMVQFIRFGNNPGGIRYLKHLDNMGKQKSRDIVDTRSIRGNVFKMFMGSIDEAADDDHDSDNNGLI